MRMRSRRKDNFPCQFVNVTFTFTITHHVHGESGRRRQKKLLHYQLGEMTLLHVAINRPFNSRQIRNCSYFSSSNGQPSVNRPACPLSTNNVSLLMSLSSCLSRPAVIEISGQLLATSISMPWKTTKMILFWLTFIGLIKVVW